MEMKTKANGTIDVKLTKTEHRHIVEVRNMVELMARNETPYRKLAAAVREPLTTLLEYLPDQMADEPATTPIKPPKPA